MPAGILRIPEAVLEEGRPNLFTLGNISRLRWGSSSKVRKVQAKTWEPDGLIRHLWAWLLSLCCAHRPLASHYSYSGPLLATSSSQQSFLGSASFTAGPAEDSGTVQNWTKAQEGLGCARSEKAHWQSSKTSNPMATHHHSLGKGMQSSQGIPVSWHALHLQSQEGLPRTFRIRAWIPWLPTK